MPDTIRQYGPGKFDTILDSYVYAVSLEGGCDDEAGSMDETGRWYGLMRHGSTIFRDHDPGLEPLNEAEREVLNRAAGVILTEDSNGFVGVEYFDNVLKLDAAWQTILEQMEPEREQT